MALFPYFPRLWTTEGVTGLRSFFLFFCVFLLYLSAKLLEIQQNNCRQMADAFFLSALLLHGSKRTSGQQSLYEKIGPATVWCKCMSVACWVPTLLHNCWKFLRSVTPMSLQTELFAGDFALFVGWLVFGTAPVYISTFQTLLWCEVVVFTWHGVYVEKRKKRTKKNTNDIF